jgi:hypothetical protein
VVKSILPGDRDLRALVLVWAGVLVLVFAGRLFTTDVAAELQVSGSFLGERPLLSAESGWTVSGISQGAAYVPHGPGYPVLLIPAAAAELLLGPEAGKVAAALVNALASLVLVSVWFLLSRKWVGEASWPRTVLLGIAGMLAVYGRMPYDVTSAAAAGMAGVLLMARDRPFPAGLCLGLALLVRLDSLVFLPAFWPGRDGIRKLIPLLGGTLPFLLLLAAANLYRFGSPFEDGHAQDPAMAFTPLSGGITGLLASPGKGLVWYAPMAVLAILRSRDFRLWLPFALSLVLHGVLYDWSGGTGWGPRFLVPTLPLLLMPLVRRGAGGKVFAVLAATGIVLTAVAAWSDTNSLEQGLGPDLFGEDGRQRVLWTFDRSPLTGAFRAFGSWPPELFGAYAAGRAGLPPWAGLAMQLAAGGALVAAGVRTGRARP